ncbi:MAG: hypothetical protein QM788_15480 [Roseateles sp.]|uniref:hypothetical protein n=1 Tax=Roseateles sp. TaxID=1971397 RepID=UPI0039E7CA48
MRSPPPRPAATPPRPSRQAVLRAVASSTAVETGQAVAALESKLNQPVRRFAHIGLAR